MTEVHAPLPPSAAARWVVCHGSAKLEAEAPISATQSNIEAAADGHAAHHFARLALTEGILPSVNDRAPNGVVADQEMVEAVMLYVQEVFEYLSAKADAFQVEQCITIPSVHPDNWGFPDAWIFHAGPLRSGILRLFDFKYGHRFVDAFENWQMIDYTAGILDKLCAEEVFDRAQITVEMIVVQPRSYHPDGPIRSWRVNAPDLDELINDLRRAAIIAKSEIDHGAELTDGVSLHVNPECPDCKGRHRCPASLRAAESAMDQAVSAVGQDIPADAIGLQLRMMERAAALLDAKITGLRAEVEAKLRAGKSVPFYQLVPAQTREAWTVEPDVVFILSDALGIELRRPQEPITPTQARKAFAKAGVSADMLTGFSARPPGGVKLEQVDNTQARKVFG